MSDFDATLERLIHLMIEKRIPVSVSVGTASDIDKEADTCKVTLTENQILHGVRLRAVVDNDENKVVVYPKEDTPVITILIENAVTEAFLLSCSNVESVVCKIGDQSIKMDSDGFVFNEGTDGMVKLTELISKLNGIVTAFNTHTHVVATTGTAAAQSGTAAAIATQVVSINKSDLEDTKIKH